MSANESGQFQLVEEKGWRRGLGNLWFRSTHSIGSHWY